MRDFLRFLFSTADQARIDAASLQVADVPYSASPATNAPYPQSLQLTFKISDPANGPIQIRPLFPGLMTFIADPAAPGVIPAPADVEFTTVAYNTWKTRGAVMIKILQKDYTEIQNLSGGLAVVPNAVWYTPISIPENFVFTTLKEKLRKADIPGTPTIRKNHPDWPKHAIARFLEGRYAAPLRLKETAAEDDVIAHPMPTVVMAADGAVSLVISTALARSAQDAPEAKFDELAAALTPGADRTNPAHPRNGAIPARHVYRSLRSRMIDAAAGNAIPDKVLEDWPSAPRYFPLRFTRTWQPIENCSVYFPANTARVENHSGGLLFEQRMPAHGILYLSQAPASPQPPPPHIKVSITGGLRFLDGATPASWRQKAGTVALVYNFSTISEAHILARRAMSEEMLVEPRYSPGEMRCTYLSLRRSVRALVDNRITGGRLNFQPKLTDKTTKDLMKNAWSGTPATANLLSNNNPQPNASPGKARDLEKILIAFFPADAPAHDIDGSGNTTRTKIYKEGEVAYNLWQTIESVLSAEGTMRNFSNDHVGRGGPGALVAVGLAPAFHVDPFRNAGESDSDYFDRIVGDMLTGLQPGAILQFWNFNTDYERIKTRAGRPDSYGHSPVFLRYIVNGGLPQGIVVIDQFGESECRIDTSSGSRLMQWDPCPRTRSCARVQQIWVAANWEE